MALSLVVSGIFNVEKYRDIEIKVIESGTIRYTGYGFLLVFYSNFVLRDIRLQKCRDLENRVRGPLRSLKMSPFDRAHMTSY